MSFSAIYLFVGFTVRAYTAFHHFDQPKEKASLLLASTCAARTLDTTLGHRPILVGDDFLFHKVDSSNIESILLHSLLLQE